MSDEFENKQAAAEENGPPEANEPIRNASDLEQEKKRTSQDFYAQGNVGATQIFINRLDSMNLDPLLKPDASVEPPAGQTYSLHIRKECAAFVERYQNSERLAVAIVLSVFELVYLGDLPELKELLMEEVDAWLGRWHEAWDKPRSRKGYVLLIISVLAVCYLSVVVPPMLDVEEGHWQAKGRLTYLWAEDAFVNWLEDHGWYTPAVLNGLPDNGPAADEPESFQEAVQIPLTVYRVPKALAIRDIPSTDGKSLGGLPNGTVVNWSGELAFGPADGGQEAWAKVVTDSGVEGWSRLNYLLPEEGLELMLVRAAVPETAAPEPFVE